MDAGRLQGGRLELLDAVWGLAFVFIRVAVMPLGPVALVALRQVIAGLALATIGWKLLNLVTLPLLAAVLASVFLAGRSRAAAAA